MHLRRFRCVYAKKFMTSKCVSSTFVWRGCYCVVARVHADRNYIRGGNSQRIYRLAMRFPAQNLTSCLTTIVAQLIVFPHLIAQKNKIIFGCIFFLLDRCNMQIKLCNVCQHITPCTFRGHIDFFLNAQYENFALFIAFVFCHIKSDHTPFTLSRISMKLVLNDHVLLRINLDSS